MNEKGNVFLIVILVLALTGAGGATSFIFSKNRAQKSTEFPANLVSDEEEKIAVEKAKQKMAEIKAGNSKTTTANNTTQKIQTPSVQGEGQNQITTATKSPKTYHSELFGFSFDYPASYQLKEEIYNAYKEGDRGDGRVLVGILSENPGREIVRQNCSPEIPCPHLNTIMFIAGPNNFAHPGFLESLYFHLDDTKKLSVKGKEATWMSNLIKNLSQKEKDEAKANKIPLPIPENGEGELVIMEIGDYGQSVLSLAVYYSTSTDKILTDFISILETLETPIPPKKVTAEETAKVLKINGVSCAAAYELTKIAKSLYKETFNNEAVGAWLKKGDAYLLNGEAYIIGKNKDSYLWSTITVPKDTDFMCFDYEFTKSEMDDRLLVFVDKDFVGQIDSSPYNVPVRTPGSSGVIPVSSYKGKTVTITFLLENNSKEPDGNTEITIDNLTFYHSALLK